MVILYASSNNCPTWKLTDQDLLLPFERSLDWTYSDEQVIQIDEFERNRGPRQKKENLIISPWTRYNLLLNKWDVPMHAIKEATAQIKIIKHSRRKSSQDHLKKSDIFRYLTSLVDKIRSYRKRQKRRKRRTLKRCVASKKNLERLYGDLISAGEVENLPAHAGNSSDRASETDKIQHVANNKNLPGRYGRPFSEHDMQSIIGNALAPTVEITTCSSALSIWGVLKNGRYHLQILLL